MTRRFYQGPASALRELFDLKLFLEVDERTRFTRRLARDVRERGRTAESVHWQWNETVEPMFKKYCEPTMVFADTVICTDEDWRHTHQLIRDMLTRDVLTRSSHRS